MAYGRSRSIDVPPPETILTTVTVALVAGVALGSALYPTGHLESIVAVYGLEGVVNEWTLVLCHSLVATVVYVSAVRWLARCPSLPRPLTESVRSPFVSGCVGVSYGVLIWLTVVAYGLPFWFGVVQGEAYPIPTHDVTSFLALTWFGLVLGALYPVVRSFFGRQR